MIRKCDITNNIVIFIIYLFLVKKKIVNTDEFDNYKLVYADNLIWDFFFIISVTQIIPGTLKNQPTY